MMVAQLPGADEAIKAAGAQGGWMAVVIVALVFLMVSALAMLVKVYMSQGERRETRMAGEIQELQTFIRDKLVGLVADCKVAFVGLTRVLGERPCLLQDRDRLEEMTEK